MPADEGETLWSQGRTISTKVTDLTLKEGGYHPVSKLRDKFYLEGDEVGHGILLKTVINDKGVHKCRNISWHF